MNNDKLMRNGAILNVAGMLFMIAETIYFDSNYWPESWAEFACDVIGGAVALTGCTMLCTGVIKTVRDFKRNHHNDF